MGKSQYAVEIVGVDRGVTLTLDKIGAGAQRAEKSFGTLAQQIAKTSGVGTAFERAQANQGRSSDELAQHLLLAAQASTRYAADQDKATAATERAAQRQANAAQRTVRPQVADQSATLGGFSGDQRSDAVARLRDLAAAQSTVTQQSGRFNAGIAGGTRQLQSLAQTSALSRQQLAQVGFQLNDFAVQVASGGGLLIPLIQQGSQLSGTFGGVRPALSAVLSLLTPVRLGVLGLAGAALGFGIAASKTEDWQRSLSNLQATLAGTGRGGQFSNGQLAALIEQISQAPGVTREAATQTVAELARMSQISGQLFGDLGRLAADYARVTGTDVPAAAKTLASAFAEPAQGVKTLDAALGTLSSTTLLTVQRLAQQGDLIGAQRALYAGLEQSVRGLAITGITPLRQATNELGNSWDRLMGQFRESQGLQNANALLGDLIKAATEAANKLPQILPKVASATRFTPLGPAAAAAASFVTPAGGDVEMPAAKDAAAVQAQVQAQVASQAAKANEDAIKRGLELGKTYQSTAGRISELVNQQDSLRVSLTLATATYGANSEQAKKLGSAVAGIGEQIASLRKRGSNSGGSGDSEARALRKAVLDDQLRDLDDANQRERDDLAAHQALLDAQYRAGEVSLAQSYAQRAALQAQAEQLDRENNEKKLERLAAAQDEASAAGDVRELARLDSDINESLREQARLEDSNRRRRPLDAREYEAALIRQEQALAEFNASVVALTGDERELARVRIASQVADARRLQTQAGAVDDRQIARYQDLLEAQEALRQSQDRLSQASARAATDEERFLIQAERRGLTLSEIDAGLFASRSRLADVMRRELDIANERALSNPTAEAIQQANELGLAYERALREIDPAINRLRTGLQGLADSTADNIGRVLGQVQSGKDALRAIFTTALDDTKRFLIEQTITAPLKKGLRGLAENALPGVAKGLGVGSAGGADAGLQQVTAAALPASRSVTALSTAADAAAAALQRIAGAPVAGVSPTALGSSFAAFDTAGRGIGTTQPSAERDVLRRIEAGTGGGGAAAVQIMDEAARAAGGAAAGLQQVTAAALPASRSVTALSTAADAAAAALQRIAGAPVAGVSPTALGSSFAAFDTAGRGVGSTQPSNERDILRRIEAAPPPSAGDAAAGHDASAQLGAAGASAESFSSSLINALPQIANAALRLDGLGDNAALANVALQYMPQVINSIIAAAAAAGSGSSGGGGLGGFIAKLFGPGTGGDAGASGVGVGAGAGYSEFAHGGAFANGRMAQAQAFAKGGAFTNRVVDTPTRFRFASGGALQSGLMGEAGPEAIMPLRRTPSGRLGVEVVQAPPTAAGAPSQPSAGHNTLRQSEAASAEQVARNMATAAAALALARAGSSSRREGGALRNGRIAQTFAKGGAFTNRVVDTPTRFRFASGGSMQSGLMGEAGPEAIMPLRRTPSGRLGVEMVQSPTAGGLGGGGVLQAAAAGAAAGATAGAPVFNFQFENAPPVESTRRKPNATGGEDVLVRFKDQLKQEMAAEVDNGTGLARSIGSRFALNSGAGLVV